MMQKVQTRRNWLVWVSIGVAVAIGLTIWAGTNMYQEQAFAVTEDDAIKIVKNRYGLSGHAITDFAFLEYSGMYNGEPQFTMYKAWSNGKSIGEKRGMLVFGVNDGNYLAAQQKDRFVWSVIFVDQPVVEPIGFKQYFVDADSGELVAIWQKQ